MDWEEPLVVGEDKPPVMAELPVSVVIDADVVEASIGAEVVVVTPSVDWDVEEPDSTVVEDLACVVVVSDFLNNRKLTDDTVKFVSQSKVAAEELTGRAIR